MTRVLVYPHAEAIATATAARLGLAIADAVATSGCAHIALTGGGSGIATLEHLSHSPLAQFIDWTSVHVWWSDERFLEAGHRDRNEVQAQEALLGRILIPEENIHRIGSASEHSSAEDAARAYSDEIAAWASPAWDVALLGVGPDGHVASLFPGHAGFTTPAAVAAVAVHESPKPPSDRVSFSLGTINRAKAVWLLAGGAAKADAVARSLAGDNSLPASAVHGTGETLWLLDVESAARV